MRSGNFEDSNIFARLLLCALTLTSLLPLLFNMDTYSWAFFEHIRCQ